VITLDTSAIVALAGPRQPSHQRTVAALLAEPVPHLVPAEILAEIGHVLEARFDHALVTEFVIGLTHGDLVCDCNTEARLPRIAALLGRYDRLRLGLADAAVIACAEANGGRVLTLDRRDFDVVAGEGRLTILP
jgi:uncharacterized protein